MRKRTCGQCSSQNDLQESISPVRTKTGKVRVHSAPLCSYCRRWAERIILLAVRAGRLTI